MNNQIFSRLAAFFIVVVGITISGCTINLTEQGGRIKLLAEQEKPDCTSLGVVTGSMSMGSSTGDEAASAMNEVRNKAADLGANSLHIISASSDAFASTVIGEAFRCNL